MFLLVKETNTWLSTNTLIKRGQYSAVRSNTRLELNGLIILYKVSYSRLCKKIMEQTPACVHQREIFLAKV